MRKISPQRRRDAKIAKETIAWPAGSPDRRAAGASNAHDATTTSRRMKNCRRCVGAGFKPALRREIGSIRHGSALGGFETRYKTVLCRYVCDVFHANFHDAYRHTPNDEKSAAWVGRIRPPGRHPPVHRLEAKTCLAPSAIDNNRRMARSFRPTFRASPIGEIFHANGHDFVTPPDE